MLLSMASIYSMLLSRALSIAVIQKATMAARLGVVLVPEREWTTLRAALQDAAMMARASVGSPRLDVLSRPPLLICVAVR